MILTSQTITSTSTMLGMIMLAALTNILPIPIIVVDSKPTALATVAGSAQNMAFYEHVSQSYADAGCIESWGNFPVIEDPTLAPPRFNPTSGKACMCGMLHSLGSSALLEYSKHDEVVEVIENGAIVSTELKESPMTIANTLNLEAKCVNGKAEGTSYPCNNVDLIAHLPLNFFTTTNTNSTPMLFNDLWGWTSEAGREFVITGVEEGTYFVEITDGHPITLGFLPSNSALEKFTMWSDMKIIGNYAYIVADQGKHGLQVFDMTRLLDIDPKSDCISNKYCIELEADVIYLGTEEVQLSKTHNIAANAETNMLYLVGVSKSCGSGMHIVDVSNPLQPTFVACFSDDGYTHDAQCVTYRGPDEDYYESEICFCFNEDTVTIVDMTDKDKMTVLSRTSYDEDSYTHQGWLSTDQSYVVFGDEYDELTNTDITNTRTLILDVTSLTSPSNLQEYFGPTAAIDHNQYIVKATAEGQDYNTEVYGNTDLVYQANYASGLRIQQVIDYDTGFMKEVGFFDTYPISDAAVLEGAWSVYPFFKSGLVAITSMREGLFIVRPNLINSLVDPLSTTMAPTQSTSPTSSPTPLTRPCLMIEGGWSDSVYGMTCDAYTANSPGTKVACFIDVNVDGIRKQDACAECGKCIAPPTNPPTNPPTRAPFVLILEDDDNFPTTNPTNPPTNSPTTFPTNAPTNAPTDAPTNVPTNIPTNVPTPICKDRKNSFKLKDNKSNRKSCDDWAGKNGKNRKKRCNKKVKKGAYKVFDNEKGRKVEAKKVKDLCPLSCQLCDN